MKTMDCLTLETLIENHEPVNLIDVRSKNEFREMHIRGARSFPLAELSAPTLFLRPQLTTDRVYVISDDRATASLATGILRSSGCSNAMVVDGGMKAWIGQGFPVLRNCPSPKLPTFLRATAILFGVAGIALALAKFLLLAVVLICGGAFLFQASLLLRASAREDRKFMVLKSHPTQWRELDGIERAHAC
jgi:rhodanese-related sulfurtransferase